MLCATQHSKYIKVKEKEMKKRFNKIISLALVLICVFALAACGGGGSGAEGTYTFKTMSMQGMTFDIEQLAETLGEEADQLKISLVLNSDGSLKLEADALEMSGEGTWKASGSTVTMTIDGEEMTATLKDGEITMSAEGITLTFKK